MEDGRKTLQALIEDYAKSDMDECAYATAATTIAASKHTGRKCSKKRITVAIIATPADQIDRIFRSLGRHSSQDASEGRPPRSSESAT